MFNTKVVYDTEMLVQICMNMDGMLYYEIFCKKWIQICSFHNRNIGNIVMGLFMII